MHTMRVEIFKVYEFLWILGYASYPQKLIHNNEHTSKSDNNYTHHAAMAMKFNAPQISLPIKNMKN